MSPIVFKGHDMNSDLILSALKIEEVGRRFHLQNIELVGFTRGNKRTPEIYLKIKLQYKSSSPAPQTCYFLKPGQTIYIR